MDKYERRTPNVSDGLPAEGVVVYLIDRSSWPPVHKRAVLSNVGDSFVDQPSGFQISVSALVTLGFTVEIKRPEPAECERIREQIAEFRAEIRTLQAELRGTAGPEKWAIVRQIKALQSQIQRLSARGNQLGCAL